MSDLEIIGNPVTAEMVAEIDAVAGDIAATVQPRESPIDRLRIDFWEDASICVLPGEHASTPARCFDVTGIPICEDCITDIAPVVAQLAAALREEREG